MRVLILVFIWAGLYVMAIGVLESGTGCVAVSAIRLSDLSSNTTHADMWPAEVVELHRLLTENPSAAT